MIAFDHDRATILHGDCVEALAQVPENSIAAIVTDPPYGIGFMGKAWDGAEIVRRAKQRQGQHQPLQKDGSIRKNPRFSLSESAGSYDFSMSANQAFQAWCSEWAAACFRVLKPGGHLLSFGGTRTYHRLAAGIEDAGFEIRDSLHWIFGTGFPKSLGVSRAIDSLLGETQPIIVEGASGSGAPSVNALGVGLNVNFATRPQTAPVTAAAAAAWHGWGTALKPGHEPIILARKPLISTVAENVLEYGTGGLNIDACRIEGSSAGGRWPANVLLDAEAAAELDAQSGQTKAGCHPGKRRGIGFTENGGGENSGTEGQARTTDSGGASRFFYVAKPGRKERDRGCANLPARTAGEATDREDGSDGLASPRAGAGRTGGARNFHPTVKPITLMRYLCRLITPPGGVVLDPFLGSGTTGIAALEEGFDFLGIEKSDEYLPIAIARVKSALEETP